LARAVKSIVAEVPDVRFLIIGGGIKMPEVQKYIADDNVEDFVIMPGIIPQVEAPKWLAACDIFTSPHVPNPDGTPFFGSPTKLFEYMAMGRGIVASRLDQIGEVLEDGRTALLVPPADPDALAAAIVKLCRDKNLRDNLGDQARKTAIEQHTWLRHVENILAKIIQINSKPV
ncbi:MAG: glycosyltransferase, partial [bacterium]